MDEHQIGDMWTFFKEYLDKKNIDTIAERFIDLLADYGVSDETFKECLGVDAALDSAINYYLDIDEDLDSYNDEWDD